MKAFLFFLAIFFSWVFFDFDYDAEGDYIATRNGDLSSVSSLERMARWSPVSGETLFVDFEIAANGPFGQNIDGLNVDQIHEVANEKRVIIYNKEIDSISLAIEELKNSGLATIHLGGNFEKPEFGYIAKNHTLESLEEAKNIKITQLAFVEDEMDSFFNFRSFPTSWRELGLVFSFWTSLF